MPEIERPEPPYLQIVAVYRERIASGELVPGDVVSSARQLAADWSISTATASRALRQLHTEGLTEGRPGIGTVVTGRRAASSTSGAPAPVLTPEQAGAVGVDLSRPPELYGAHDAASLYAAVMWAAGHGLRYSDGPGCLWWLERGECLGTEAHLEQQPHVEVEGGWAQRVSAWTRDGAPAAVVAHPEELDAEELGELAGVAGRGRRISVHVDGSSWCSHRAILLVFTPRGRPLNPAQK